MARGQRQRQRRRTSRSFVLLHQCNGEKGGMTDMGCNVLDHVSIQQEIQVDYVLWILFTASTSSVRRQTAG